MSLHYAQNVRNTGPSNVAETFGFEDADWHQAASGDTGTSHTLPGRLYIVQCEWCPEAFAAKTKGEAMDMFRAHEDSMLNPVSVPSQSHIGTHN